MEHLSAVYWVLVSENLSVVVLLVHYYFELLLLVQLKKVILSHYWLVQLLFLSWMVPLMDLLLVALLVVLLVLVLLLLLTPYNQSTLESNHYFDDIPLLLSNRMPLKLVHKLLDNHYGRGDDDQINAG